MDAEARRIEAFNTYARARAIVMFSCVFGFRPSWPDRPADLPEDFDETHLAVLARELVEAFGEPEGWRPESDDAELDDGEWGRVCADDDGPALLAYLDRHIVTVLQEAVASLTAEAP